MNNLNSIKKKSLPCFTLIELLVVMGILGILMAVTILVINPAEYLRRARDTNRISDLNTLKTALTLYTVDTGNDYSTVDNTVYVSLPDTNTNCSTWGLPALPSPWVYKCVTTANYRKADGTGWVPINLASMASKPLSTLPVDPTNNLTYYYTFVRGGSFELNAITESTAYKTGPSTAQNLPGVISAGTKQNLSPIYNTTGLVGYWNFDETSGTTANDSSGNGNTGTLTNGPTHVTGKVGNALSFDGTDDYVNAGNPDILKMGNKDFTISLWFELTQIGVSQSLLTKGRSFESSPYDNKGWAISINNSTNKVYVDTYKAGLRNSLTSNKVFSLDGQEYYLTIVKTGTSAKLYFNGQLDNTGSAVDVIEDGTYNVFIGRNGNANFFFNGLIDDVRVYNRTLSAAEILAQYNATK